MSDCVQLPEYLSTDREKRVMGFLVFFDLIGPLLVTISGLTLPEIIGRLNDENQGLMVLWLASDIIGPVLLVTIVLSPSMKIISKTFAIWSTCIILVYIGWQLSKSFLSEQSPIVSVIVIIALLLIVDHFRPNLSAGSIHYRRFLQDLGRSKLTKGLFALQWSAAVGYGVFLLLAVPVLFPNFGVWAYMPGALELVGSTFTRLTAIRTMVRGKRLEMS